MNFSIINGVYLMYQSMWKAIEEFPDAIIDLMKDGVEVRVNALSC
jgi:conserved oligomeric Golgi complex subunit 5